MEISSRILNSDQNSANISKTDEKQNHNLSQILILHKKTLMQTGFLDKVLLSSSCEGSLCNRLSVVNEEEMKTRLSKNLR